MIYTVHGACFVVGIHVFRLEITEGFINPLQAASFDDKFQFLISVTRKHFFKIFNASELREFASSVLNT